MYFLNALYSTVDVENVLVITLFDIFKWLPRWWITVDLQKLELI